jgi:acyl carrier protein phosphodiesterase
MNFLGHLYFSNNDTPLMYANLFGDFVKGKDLERFSDLQKKGIILHRALDQYIDHHPAVLELMHQLYPHLPKVTGIAIDLFFDHLLAKQWDNYHSSSLNDFLTNFYSVSIQDDPNYTEEYKIFIQQLKRHNWIASYPHFFALEKMSQGVSSRISFKNSLVTAPEVYLQFESQIEQTFTRYMIDAQNYFPKYF